MVSKDTQEQKKISKNEWFIGSLILAIVLVSIGYQIYEPIHNQSIEEQRLLNLDITSILIEVNDLPTGYYPGSINNLEPDNYSRFVQGKEQQIRAPDGNPAGIARVYLFSIKNEQDEMYNFLSLMETPEGMIPLDVVDIGEKQLAAINPFGLIVFTRCTAIGYVQIDFDEIKKGYDTDLLIAHAKRLDEELKTIACKQP